MTQVSSAFFERLDLRSDLVRGFEAGEFYLTYQPVVALDTGRVSGVEALLRWAHPRRGVLTPDSFITTAEESGVIVPIGGWALDAALAQLVRWRRQGLREGFFISVNVSPRQLLVDDFAEKVRAAMTAQQIEPEAVHLELTESSLIEDSTPSVQLLEATRALGVELTVDDFGKGYSSLAYLKLLPVSALKIDRNFVIDVDTDEDDARIIGAIVSLAHSLRMSVIAEGAESLAQAARLRSLGCDYGQGFVWSEPLDGVSFWTWLTNYEPLALEASA